MTNDTYWTIKHRHGWLDLDFVSLTSHGAIEKYLSQYQNGDMRDWTWAKHQRKHGVSVVRVRLVEVEKESDQ